MRSGLVRKLLLVAAVIVAYIPALHGGFVWDDDVYLTRNPLITATDGLRRIWLSTDAPSQYFPLVYSSFRAEHALWGFEPFGYHAVNVLVHAANALLLWNLLSLLAVPGAGIAAALFALHPLQVESVAWVTERKNVLSLFFSLLCLRAWLSYLDAAVCRRGWPYAAALAAHLLALLAKTTAAANAVLLLLLCWQRGERPGRSRLWQVAPFFAAGLALGLLSLWWERNHQGASGPRFDLPLPERVLLAGRAFWFYLGKLAWPSRLTFVYPRWRLDTGVGLAWLWPVSAAALLLTLWRARARLGRGPAAAALAYVTCLAPFLGFFTLYTYRYTFVADHYAYVACIGPLALAATALVRGGGPPSVRGRLRTAGPVLLCLALGVLTWRQAGVYRDEETLWQDTLRKHPASAIAASNLGLVRMREGRLEEAAALFGRALGSDPGLAEAHANLGLVRARQGQFPAALEEYRQALRTDPGAGDIRLNYAVLLMNQGQVDEAERELREVLRGLPRNALAHYNLGILSLRRGNPDAAAASFVEALRLQPGFANAHLRLAGVLAARGAKGAAREHLAAAIRSLPADQARAARREFERAFGL